MANAYDALFTQLVETPTTGVKIKTDNPQAVRTGLSRAKTDYNKVMEIVGMSTITKSIFVECVPATAGHYKITLADKTTKSQSRTSFEIIQE